MSDVDARPADDPGGHDDGWRAALEEMRRDSAHYYADHFDWRGHRPPQGFSGPRYFAPSDEWRLRASLDTAAPGSGTHVALPTSTGRLREMVVARELVFAVGGREQRLLAYAPHDADEEGWLFVPFRDATSGTETYGAGRYLDVPPARDATYELDFNRAYNPSCAYSPAYDCPYAPPPNRLDIPVRPAEMVSFEHADAA